MRALFKIALRNIFRHKKRSFITISAIAFGLGALIFLRSFVHGAQSQMTENVTSALTGDIQILPKALENIYNTNGAIENPAPIRTILQDPRIQGFAENIIGGGLISSSSNSMATFIVGIDPGKEAAIGNELSLVAGRKLASEEPYGAIIGKKMAGVLGIELGDKVVVTAQDYYGSLAGEAYTVIGLFEIGNDQIDNSNVLLLKSTAQRLLSFDQRISKFVIKLAPGASMEEVVQDLRTKIRNPELKVLTWEEMIPMIAQMMRFQNGMIFVVMTIVLIVVAAGILNTLMMSVIERIREFGLMMALGTKPSGIIFLVLCESFLLATAGVFTGLLMGIGTTLYFGKVGVDLSWFVSTFSNLLIGSQVFPRVDWYYLTIFLGVVFLSNVLVSLYPAWKASRLEPIEAMRQVG